MSRLWRGGRVTPAAARTALIATALVAAGYLVVAAATYVIVTARLTSAIDARLASSLRFMAAAHALRGSTLPPPRGAGFGGRFGPPLVLWWIGGDGQVTSVNGVSLPAGARDLTGPQTITVGGEQIRAAGERLPDGDRVVLGFTLSAVSQAQRELLLTEALIAPVLLGAVFLGAFAVGRRVADPIELARRRQLELTADASHELRTPLSVIEAEASLALTGRRTTAWYREAFGRIDQESKRMRALVDDLLWLARMDSETPPAAGAEPVDVGVLAAQAAGRFQAIAQARGQVLDVGVPALGPVVEAPPDWLDRLLGVLLDNACRYTPAGGRIEVSAGEEGGRARLTVEDSGPGIPEAERGRVFDRFHRASEQAGGAGLGLAIADAVVRATGGRWELATSHLGGAAMTVSWKAAGPPQRERRPLESRGPGQQPV